MAIDEERWKKKIVQIKTYELPSALEERKMAYSAHAYVRRGMRYFYEWLIDESGHKLSDGPPICIALVGVPQRQQ